LHSATQLNASQLTVAQQNDTLQNVILHNDIMTLSSMTLSIMELSLMTLGRMTTNRTPLSRAYLIGIMPIVSNMHSQVWTAEHIARLPPAMLVKLFIKFAQNVHVSMCTTKRMF
jgi:hypothetical protein